ncbi:Ferredoxin--NADP(+) reductase actinobacterial (eukaryote-like) type [Patulibacter medicamentivorans]|uniref:ferredoxin--NADP(+) reductase n=1 Tax=Patulibacter medicamentivorans TaxID=1097667 RepID=H0EA50_9ACTN|nr:FAD-dependent oxidoreductase [Patulibacter medicamentivorans]EHN09390.1 Ferredoxin--NADP(+) reductase actinobacterial (eukaryote-like) type [Patulibacter medicamentivorans]
MSDQPETPARPLKVAIVGAGPAGFYAAGQLLAAKGVAAEVDLFDKLPTPYGLVRFGVAPDHPKIKSVTRVYEKIAQKPGFRFFGNVEVGKDITHAELLERHHAVLYATGASHDRRLGIPGEDLPGSHPATEFVAWYNGHPEARDLEFDLSAKRAVVIGNGNVAVDVARMLGLDAGELRETDTADHAIEALIASEVEEIVMLGRRGLAQAAFTNPELRELGEMADCDIVVDPAEVALDEHSARWLERDDADVREKRNVEIATEYSTRTPEGKKRRIVLRFLASPVRILGEDRVEGIEIVRNELVADDDGWLSARPTEETEVIECGLVLRSIGYRGTKLHDVPFDDQRATIRNVGGRVIDENDDEQVPGVYTAGWIKRGPSGIIGTNKKCAQGTVDALLEDLESGQLPEPTVTEDDLPELVAERKPDHVDWSAWSRIDAHEQALGEPQGRPRVKLTRISEMVDVATAAGAVGERT